MTALQRGDGSAILGYLRDKNVSWWRKWVGVGALFYLVWPFDLIPDAIPIIGWLDDLGVLTLAAAWYIAEIRRWAAARAARQQALPPAQVSSAPPAR